MFKKNELYADKNDNIIQIDEVNQGDVTYHFVTSHGYQVGNIVMFEHTFTKRAGTMSRYELEKVTK